jgi:glucose dehydrogenase
MKISPHYSMVRALQIVVFGLFVTAEAGESPWNGWGGNTNNDRWASSNSQISSSNIHSTKVSCQIPFPEGVSATPTILEDIAYFPVWNGSFIALDYTTCKVKWNIDVTEIVLDFAPRTSNQSVLETTNVLNAISRTSATIDSSNQILYFGTLLHALIVAVDLNTGKVLNKTQVHSHPFAEVTCSGTLHDGILYTGVSSAEENAQTLSLPCCSFIGKALALEFDRSTNQFTTKWEVDTLPPPGLDPWTGVGIVSKRSQ